MSLVELLWRLQELDTSLQDLDEEERDLPLRREVEGMEDELSDLLAELEKSGGELEGLRERIRKGERSVEGLSKRIAAEEDRLYGGKVSNPKELRSIQAEVQALKRKRDQEETGLLEMMERAEELEARLGELESRKSSLQGRLEKARGVLRGEIERIGVRRDELRGEVEKLRGEIPPDALSLYDELMTSKHGLAVAKVLEGTCQGCHMALPAQEYDRFLKSDGIFRCSNCRRILVA